MLENALTSLPLDIWLFLPLLVSLMGLHSPLRQSLTLRLFHFLSLDGISAIVHIFYMKGSEAAGPWKAPTGPRYQTVAAQCPSSAPKPSPPGPEGDITGVERSSSKLCSTTKRNKSRLRRCGCTTLKVCNRIFMVIHTALVILSVAGAMELALTYRFTNPYVKIFKIETVWTKNLTSIGELWFKSLSRQVKNIISTIIVLRLFRPTLLCPQYGSKLMLHTVLSISWGFKHLSLSTTVAIHAPMTHQTLGGPTLFRRTWQTFSTISIHY